MTWLLLAVFAEAAAVTVAAWWLWRLIRAPFEGTLGEVTAWI